MFIDFLLDESPLQARYRSVTPNYAPEPANPQQILEVASYISSFVWQFYLLEFETVLRALADRITDPNAASILVHLLGDKNIVQRVEYFMNLGVPKEHWNDDAFYAKHRDFETRFPSNPKT